MPIAPTPISTLHYPQPRPEAQGRVLLDLGPFIALVEYGIQGQGRSVGQQRLEERGDCRDGYNMNVRIFNIDLDSYPSRRPKGGLQSHGTSYEDKLYIGYVRLAWSTKDASPAVVMAMVGVVLPSRRILAIKRSVAFSNPSWSTFEFLHQPQRSL